MLCAAYDAYSSGLEGVKDIKGLTLFMSFEPLPPQIYQHNAAGNALGLTDRSGSRVVCLFSQALSDDADNERATAAHDLGTYDPFIYLNYAGDWQDPISSYGDESVQQLR